MFVRDGDRVTVEIHIKAEVSEPFAQKALMDAIARKNNAVLIGDGISLDMLLGALPKEAINDFGSVIHRAS